MMTSKKELHRELRCYFAHLENLAFMSRRKKVVPEIRYGFHIVYFD